MDLSLTGYELRRIRVTPALAQNAAVAGYLEVRILLGLGSVAKVNVTREKAITLPTTSQHKSPQEEKNRNNITGILNLYPRKVTKYKKLFSEWII